MGTRDDANPKALVKARAKHVRKTRGTGLTRRVRDAIEALIWGDALTLKAAAEAAGLTDRAFRLALRKLPVLAHYRAELEALRDGERAANLRTLVGIRDDKVLKGTAAGQKARIEAVKAIEMPAGEQRSGPNINVNVGVGINQTVPGYVIDMSRFDPAEIAKILRDAGSTRSIFDDLATVTIDGKAKEVEPVRGPHVLPEGT